MAIPVLGAIVKAAAEIKNIPVEIRQNTTNPIRAQRRELRKLLVKAQFTEFGKFYHFDEILLSRNILEEFRKRVPVFDYNKMHDEWWYLNLQASATSPGRARSSISPSVQERRRPPASISPSQKLSTTESPKRVYASWYQPRATISQ